MLGAGAAGAAAVETLRREGYAGPIMLIGAESPGTVDRPNLSKHYLAGTAPEDQIPLWPASFYREIGVTLRVGPQATSLDVERRRIAFADGEMLEDGALLLATGGSRWCSPSPGRPRRTRTHCEAWATPGPLSPGRSGPVAPR